ncbi:hypothetical protein [Dyella subtropica]|uniref:hypothetical protein n=1 Tax=Dyella subtropica TaxID=2992127 RepID=UPI00225981D7|nr:hypothetical protein [Dyella subtropica]
MRRYEGHTLERTAIDGLRWEANASAMLGAADLVGASPGPQVAEIVTHEAGFTNHHYGIHIGQIDRLTFFGQAGQRIHGSFIDCRIGSPTLHRKVSLVFEPSPLRKLVIDRGIAHTFSHIEHVVTRDEPLWLLTEHNPAYSFGNDLLNFPLDVSGEAIPIVPVNHLPIPDCCYKYVLERQHQTYLKQVPVYGTRYRIWEDGAERYALVKQNTWQMPPGHGVPCAIPDWLRQAAWRPSFFAASGGDSYYIIQSPGVEKVDFITPEQTGTASQITWRQDDGGALLTFFGRGRIRVTLKSPGRLSPTLQFAPDPLHSLRVPAETEITVHSKGFLLIRRENLAALHPAT